MTEQNENEATEHTETVETDVETAQQPEGSQPTEVPAAEPEAAVEAPAGETAAEEPAVTEEPAPAAPAADAPAAPPGEPRRKRLKHVPRKLRGQRPKRKHAASAERKPIVRLEKPEHERGRRQERRGVVVSSAMDKTIVVRVDSTRAHPRYKKVVRRSVKFHAHDEQNQAKVGDVVLIIETRPLSKTKNWRLAEVVEAAK